MNLSFSLVLPFSLSAQAASISDGINLSYYETLGEALVSAVKMTSTIIDLPVEITLLKDIVLDEPFTIPDNVYIRLVTGNMTRTIRRGSSLIEYPVIWARGNFRVCLWVNPVWRRICRRRRICQIRLN